VDPIADLELGRAQELAVLLAGEQFGEAAQVRLGGLAQGVEDLLGAFGLLGAEVGPGHESPP
jgi:hypothetical protein